MKQNSKSIGMTRETMTNLISQLQLFVMVMNRSFDNRKWESSLLAISKYLGQACYDCFNNIDKLLGSDKYYCRLRTIVKRYKGVQMLVALRTLNNIIAHKIIHAHCGILLDSFWHQTISNFNKLIK